jgi:hypothetical protein
VLYLGGHQAADLAFRIVKLLVRGSEAIVSDFENLGLSGGWRLCCWLMQRHHDVLLLDFDDVGETTRWNREMFGMMATPKGFWGTNCKIPGTYQARAGGNR